MLLCKKIYFLFLLLLKEDKSNDIGKNNKITQHWQQCNLVMKNALFQGKNLKDFLFLEIKFEGWVLLWLSIYLLTHCWLVTAGILAGDNPANHVRVPTVVLSSTKINMKGKKLILQKRQTGEGSVRVLLCSQMKRSLFWNCRARNLGGLMFDWKAEKFKGRPYFHNFTVFPIN